MSKKSRRDFLKGTAATGVGFWAAGQARAEEIHAPEQNPSEMSAANADAAVGAKEGADLLLLNGKIITVDETFSIHSAMAVRGEKIVAVGSNGQLRSLRGANTRVVDLQGKSVLPGLIDSHGHPAVAAVTEFDHPVPDMDSIQNVLDYIKSRSRAVTEGDWIWVSQVFLTRLKEERYPTRAELDAAARDNPCVFRTGPDASVNTLALKEAGIDRSWTPPDGGPGFAEKDPRTGEPTGILRSCGAYLKSATSVRRPTVEEHAEKLAGLFADYNRVGITGIGERAAGSETIDVYQALAAEDRLTVRSFISQHVGTVADIRDIRRQIRRIAQNPLVHGGNMLRLGAVKTFLDGGMLTGSAYMQEPWGVGEAYSITDPNYRGVLFIPPEKLVAVIEVCMENDIQFMAHTVGDGAVHSFIDACAALGEKFNIREKRPVICHSNFMSEEDVRRVAELGICMDIQPAWLYLDGRTLSRHFGYERLARFQPLRSLFAVGAIAGGGSDHMQKIGSLRSINFYDPWLGMWVALTRNYKWMDQQPLHPEQSLDRVQAIRFYTINNAYLHCAEKERGSLEPGKLADFIILENDPLTCSLDALRDMKVRETYLGGRRVYALQT